MKIEKIWKRVGLIYRNNTICWSNISSKQQIEQAKEDNECCGYVVEKMLLRSDKKIKSYRHIYFFGQLVEKEFVLQHFSQMPGFEDWLHGYNKMLFVFIPSVRQLFKLYDGQAISFVTR